MKKKKARHRSEAPRAQGYNAAVPRSVRTANRMSMNPRDAAALVDYQIVIERERNRGLELCDRRGE
jgi:hypothetical protein